jgi:tRNA (guanosine-2'-O-)-methyltransferase
MRLRKGSFELFKTNNIILFSWTRNSIESNRNHKNSNTRLYGSSRPSYRRREAELTSKQGAAVKELNWDHYEFSHKPKKDNRFTNNAVIGELDEIEETAKDQESSHKLNQQTTAYLALPTDVVTKSIEILEPYINTDRLQRVYQVMSKRTKNCKFLFENPSNPSNVWACLRTIDSFGVQNVDVIIDSGKYAGKQALIQKKGMRTAMGSAQWLSLRNYPSTLEAVKDIKENQGYKIFASDLNPSSKDVRDLEWDVGPVCIVMGNEELGISDEMRELADETFTLPMVGFAESFNLSVATSITLAHMSAKSKNGKGPLKPGDLDEHEFNCLYLKGLLNSLPQKKLGPAILRQNGIHLPHEFNLL